MCVFSFPMCFKFATAPPKLHISSKLFAYFLKVSFNTCLKPHFPSCQATIYGKRSGCLRGLAVLNKDKANVFRSSQGWKHAVIHQVQMLPRSGMYKPDAARQLELIFCYPKKMLCKKFSYPRDSVFQGLLPKKIQTKQPLRLSLCCRTWAGPSLMLRSFDRKLVFAYGGAILHLFYSRPIEL